MTNNDESSTNIEIEFTDDWEGGFEYAREKLGVAVWKLATGVDGIKSRLADAYIELVILQESDFPSHLVDDWKQIKADLTSGKMQYRTVVKNGEIAKEPVGLLYSTLRYMRKEKAKEIARRICSLKAEVELYLEGN
ncbi:MAG: hypothetical protein OEV06_08995 [Anaerolineae bacterium]|nr:hypothetical protein [Anaerolineae bacterium]